MASGSMLVAVTTVVPQAMYARTIKAVTLTTD